MRLPISIRLTIWYVSSLLVLLSLFVVFLYTSFHISLHQDFDDQLRAEEARLLQAVLAELGRVPTGEYNRDALAREAAVSPGTFVRLLNAHGDVVYQSSNFATLSFIPLVLPRRGESMALTRTWQGAPVRTRYAPIATESGRFAGWLEVTRPESAVHRELHRLRWLLVVGILLGVAVSAVSGYGLARRALRPVSTIIEVARRSHPEDTGMRLPTEFGARDELTDLAETLNALLARLDESLERERRFRADAAHEILTPISALRSEIEVALRRPRDQEAYRATLATVATHTTKLATLVEDLLRLSRAEAGGSMPPASTDLGEVAEGAVQRFCHAADAKNIEMRVDAEETVADVDRTDFTTVVENLVDNAIKYTPTGGSVGLSVFREGADAVVRVVDSGIGFDPGECPRLFDRFYRANSDIVQGERGSGLGLAIVAAIVRSGNGRVSAFSPGRNLGSTFEVRYPVVGETRNEGQGER